MARQIVCMKKLTEAHDALQAAVDMLADALLVLEADAATGTPEAGRGGRARKSASANQGGPRGREREHDRHHSSNARRTVGHLPPNRENRPCFAPRG
jgi:hypothetical protein